MIKIKTILSAITSVTLLTGMGATAPVFADTLDDVKKRGFLRCGTGEAKAGFAMPGDNNQWQGMEIDYCKALSSAVFGDETKFEVVPVTSKVRFTSLTSREIDVLVKGTTWTYSRDAKLGVDFAAYWFFDGQGFLIKKELGVTSAKQLNGATICISPGTTSEKNVADYFRTYDMKYKPVVIKAGPETLDALQKGRCDVITNDLSALASDRQKFTNPDDFVVLQDNIAKEPLSLYVRQNDSRWKDVITWTRNALVEAEELGITQENVGQHAKHPIDPRIARLLGSKGAYGEMLGLPNTWAHDAISAVGNYGEIFERNVGEQTRMGLTRNLNQQWYDGGLVFAPPFR